MYSKYFGIIGYIAKRFLFSKNSDQFLSFITWISIAGVSLGVLALVVVTAATAGFENELSRVISGMNGDIILYSRGSPVRDPEQTISKIRKVVPEVKAVTPSLVSQMMVSGPLGSKGAVLEGVDLSSVGKVTHLLDRIVEGKMAESEDEVVLGKDLAERLGVKVGDAVRLIVPDLDEGDFDLPQGTSPRYSAPRVETFTVSGISHLGLYRYDSKFVFSSIQTVQKFLKQPGKATTFKIKLGSDADPYPRVYRLTENFGYPFKAKAWSQMNRNLFYAIQLEKTVILIVLAAIVIVAAFNIVSTLMMMIHDKTQEVAILKAMGFRRHQSFGLFCAIGFGIGIVGAGTGVLLGLLVAWGIAKTQWIQLPAEIYYLGHLPILVRWQEVAGVAGFAILVAFLAAVYPAWQVSRKSPLEGLRHD